ncbi:hypothetical protein FGG78_36270, partial [Thioclava sp. BHET1]
MGDVFAHSMWRTGSTALARCFLSNPKYMVFYEPFHEYIASREMIIETTRAQCESSTRLGHPEWAGGYFDTYLQRDPQTGKPLHELFDDSVALTSVYHKRPSAKARAFIAACSRVAEAQGKTAFFGFCRSGCQQGGLQSRRTTSFYLWRAPRAQFRSYNWPENDYFVPRTIIQLARARRLWPILMQLLPARTMIRIIRTGIPAWYHATEQSHFYLKTARQLPPETHYALFYLSHRLSYLTAQKNGLPCLTISDICGPQRSWFEEQCEVSTALLQPTPDETFQDLPYAEIEDRVERLL